MAASIDGVLEETLQKRINSCKLLVVGAGGIGCELIKNLVLTGFHNVELVSTRVANPSIRFVWHPSAGGVALGRRGGAWGGGGGSVAVGVRRSSMGVLDYALRMNSAPTLITIGANCSSGVLSIRTGRPYIS